MDFTQLRSLLQQPYSRNTWLEILRFVFAEQMSIDTKAENISIEKGKAKNIQRFASIALQDNINIAVIEIETKKEIQIARNRVALRDIVFKLIDQDRYHGLLVLYYSEDGTQQDYRLSFISSQTEFDADGNLVKSQTSPKRFSYVLGVNESCTTATQRFLHLKSKITRHQPFADNKIISLKDLLDAFSVEALNKEFFKKYKEIHYKNFWEYIANTPKHAKLLLDKEPTELIQQQKPIRDFIKKLLGRIVFLHFLQKKGWMGCSPETESWENGDKQFMQNLFANYKDKEHFYSSCLIELFHNTLNNADRKNGLFKHTKTRVPYLNGGLFDDDQPHTNIFDFPVEYFKDLFDFFSQYNFTIDENSPDEQEVGIDPEMLGHIFENLLEDNKDKGTFYTPRQIVHYMCQESLIEYLKTHLPNHDADAINGFIRNSDIGDKKDKKNYIVNNAKRIEELLDKLKICDPAIGSGAFPMGMLQEIFKAKLALDLTLDRALVKKEIIQNSIYGVDIEKGAVDIARLRFWLALVVDEDEPQPLPNLDYKIMQGNSLLESFEGVDLSKLIGDEAPEDVIIASKGQMELQGFGKSQTVFVFDKTTKEEIQGLINLYFDFDVARNKKYKTKQAVKQAINKVVDGKLSAKFALDKIALQDKLAEKQQHLKVNTITAKDPKGIVARKEKAIQKLNKEIETLEYKINHFEDVLNKLTQWEHEDNNRTYFLWHTYFKDVFDEGGFDIVIGNPPYVQLQKMGKHADILEQAGYDTFVRTGDIYCLFYEAGFKLLKTNGILTFITSNKWMRAAYGEALRKYFTTNTNPLSLIDFGGFQVFESATVDTNIFVGQKAAFQNRVNTCVLGKGFSLNNMSDYFEQHTTKTAFNSGSWVVLSSLEQNIKQKIENAGIPLKDWDINICRGILTGYNEAFIIDSVTRDKLIASSPNSVEIIRPILRGRDIGKYTSAWNDLYIIGTFPSLQLNIDDYPAIKEHLLSFGIERLEQTGTSHNINGEIISSRKRTRNKWFETQDQIGFWQDFVKPKIIWKRIGSVLRFCYDETGVACLDSTCFATGKDMKFLAGYLNSSICTRELLNNSPKTGTGDVIVSVQALEPIRVPKATKSQKDEIARLVDKCIIALSKNANADTSSIETEIDDLIFELYGIHETEKQVILAT